MGLYDEMDLMLTDDGDLVIGEQDFATVSNAEAVVQEAKCRLKSSDPEWFMASICGNLEDLLGLDNTPETGKLGEELITASLTAEGFIDMEDLYVRAVPVDKKTLVFFVYFKLPNVTEPIGFEVTINLSTGATIRSV